jgi:hypothetical protein
MYSKHNYYTLLFPCRYRPEDASLIIGIGPWHALGHKVECASKWGARALEGTGRTFGDAIEHLWAILRPHNPSLKYMAKAPMRDYIEHLVCRKTGTIIIILGIITIITIIPSSSPLSS